MPYANPKSGKLKKKEHYLKNKAYINAASNSYYLKNRVRILETRKKYQVLKKDLIQARRNQRWLEDVQYKLQLTLRNRVNDALRLDSKRGSAVRDLGCSIAELKVYLESKFKKGMTWDNWTHSGWHIDHIKPIASFDLTDRKQFLQAVHYTNLQPLWAAENYHKAAKI